MSNPGDLKGMEAHAAVQQVSNEDSSTNSSIVVENKKKGVIRAHNRTIIILLTLILVPLFAFTAALIGIVLAKQVEERPCAYDELCLTDRELNHTKYSEDNYIVDYPASKLVFIASWSSRVSFALIGCIMSIYGYIAARWLLEASDAKNINLAHPSPYQITLLIRVLNRDFLVLWDAASEGVKDMFRKKKVQTETVKADTRRPGVLSSTMLVFFVSILCCILIQSADTYLHVETKAIDLVEALTAPALAHEYSHGLNDICLNQTRDTVGFVNTTDFWSCAMEPRLETQPNIVTLSEMNAAELKMNRRDEYLEWTNEEDGSQMAILAPRNVEENIDYLASSFGVTSTCSPIINSTCDLSNSTERYGGSGLGGFDITIFNCSKERAGIEVSGQILPLEGQFHYMDFHKNFDDAPAFSPESMQRNTEEQLEEIAAIPAEQLKNSFRNPWNWISFSQLDNWYARGILANKTHPYGWWHEPTNSVNMLLHCTTTIWDIEYRRLNGTVEVVKQTPSNSTTTGISSMITASIWGKSLRWMLDLAIEAAIYPKTPTEYVTEFSRLAAQKQLAPLVGTAGPRPSLKVQERQTRVVTKVPKAAMWLLVTANMVFALFSLIMGVVALRASSTDVHQVQTRLSISGLAAQLFEQQQSQNKVSGRSDLFEKQRMAAETSATAPRTIGIQRTKTGGTVFAFRQ